MRTAAIMTEPANQSNTRASWARPMVAIAAGLITQFCFYYFWQLVARDWVGSLVLPFGRKPDDVVALLLPFLGGLVAASYDRRGWWWLGQLMALPAFGGLHLLFAAGIEMTYSRPPTMQEELKFFLLEGPKLLAGFIGSYLGALLQSE